MKYSILIRFAVECKGRITMNDIKLAVLNQVKNNVLKTVLSNTQSVVRNLKSNPNQAWVGIGKPQHKLTKAEVFLARVALAAVVAGLEIILEK
jgi:hypothetical protein